MTTFGEYIGCSYGIPWSFFVVLLIYLGILSNYRAAYFIVDIVLGIRRIPAEVPDKPNCPSTTDQQQSEETNNTKTTCCTCSMSKFLCCCRPFINFRADHLEYVSIFFYIKQDKKIKFDRKLRLISFFMTITILTVLLTFIYESCILSNATITIGDWCPDYEAQCFDELFMPVFNCTPYQKVNFDTDSTYVWCFGWIYDQMTFHKVIDAVGVCGGLLGIISCTVPWTYHLSYNENKPWKAFCWIWVPCLPFGAAIFITIFGGTRKWAPPSMLTCYSLGILAGLTTGAWWRAYRSAITQKKE